MLGTDVNPDIKSLGKMVLRFKNEQDGKYMACPLSACLLSPLPFFSDIVLRCLAFMLAPSS